MDFVTHSQVTNKGVEKKCVWWDAIPVYIYYEKE